MSKIVHRSNAPFASVFFLIFHLILGFALYHYAQHPDRLPWAKSPAAEQAIP
jgi:hypothetical protein